MVVPLAVSDSDAALINLRRSARPPPPLNFTEDKVEAWKRFKTRWGSFMLLSSLETVDRKLQIAQLQNCLGDDALKLLDGFKFDTPNEERTVKEVLVEEYVIGQVNETLERYKFGKRCQAEGESFSKFLADLRRLIKSCGYCSSCESSILRDRIVIGVRDEDTRENLLKESKLTLNQCIDICKAGEAATSHRSSLSDIDKVCNMNVAGKKEKPPKSGKCKFCGQEHIFIKEKCPAWGKVCSMCKGRNHSKNVCRKKTSGHKKTKPAVNQVDDEIDSFPASDESSSSGEWVSKVTDTRNERAVKCKMLIDKKEVIFQIDTGAHIFTSILSL